MRYSMIYSGIKSVMGLFVMTVVLVSLSACWNGDDHVGGGTEDQEDTEMGPVNVTPQLDTERRVTEVIGEAGGILEASAGDGTTFTLTIPADTLALDTNIVVTPVAAIPDLPSSASLLAAVQFEPHGLELFPAATLDITLPPGVNPEGTVAFAYDGSGQDLQGALALRLGEVVRFVIPHFSGNGLAKITTDASSAGTSILQFFDIFDVENLSIEQFANTAFILYEDNFGEIVDLFEREGLSFSSELALDLLGEYGTWKELVFQESKFDVQELLKFEPLVAALDEGDRVSAALLRELIAHAHQDCLVREILTDANRMLELQKMAAWIGVDKPEEQLDFDTVLLDLCVHIAFEEVSFPQQPLENANETLRVVVGHAYGGGQTLFTEEVRVSVVGERGVTIPADTADLLADDNGMVEATAIPTGGNIEIRVGACLQSEFFPRLDGVCQDAFVVRGLVISPTTTTIAPGESQQFTAEMLGVVLTNLVWTAEGGSIDQSGLFVAGNEAGTFTITASSIDDPSITGTARVTIAGEPVANKIAFVSNRDGNNEIYLMDADGTNPQRLTNDLQSDTEPSLSPDGTRVAFTRQVGAGFLETDIFVVGVDGANLQRLTNSPQRESNPSWSPEGTKIAFTFNPGGSGTIEIFVMDADGSNLQQLTDSPSEDSDPSWSPDGTKIAFMSARDGNEEIYVMDADGSNQKNLSNHPFVDSLPSWSPDGTKIAFVSLRDSFNSEIYVMNADGSNQQRLTDHFSFDSQPSWSPDGTKVVFASSRDGNSEIYVMDAAGGDPQNLTNHPSSDSGPSWSP